MADNQSEKLHPNRQEDEQDMEMTPVVLGPPAYGSPDPATSAGQMVPVSEHPLELSEDFGKDAIAEGGDAGEAQEEEEDDGRPAKSATREEWDEYAKSKGLDPDEYSSKDDLIEALS